MSEQQPFDFGPGSTDSPEVPPHVPAYVEPRPFDVEVRKSAKRKRTVGAQLIGGVLRLSVPSWMSEKDIAYWVGEMSGRFRRKLSTDRFDLTERSRSLARRYELPIASDIRWADNMLSRWGSCTPEHGTIRLATRLAAFPDWVVDYVIVHELAHIAVPSHSAEFWQLVGRYPRTERAIGYLIAKSGDETID